MPNKQTEREAELPSITDKAFLALPENPTMKDFNAKWGVRIECSEYEELENDIFTLLEEAKREGRKEEHGKCSVGCPFYQSNHSISADGSCNMGCC